MRHLTPWLTLLLLLGSAAHAEQVPDPEFLQCYAETYRFRLGRPSRVSPAPDGKTVLFLRSGPRSFVRDLYELDVASGEERQVLTARFLLAGGAEQLSDEEQARRERQRLAARGIASYQLSRDGRRLLVPLSGRVFVVDRSDGSVRELESDAGYPLDPRFSPDGTKIACVREGELYVIDVASGTERRLTLGAGEHRSHGLSEFVAQEEMRRNHGFWWSPDSRTLLYQQTDTSAVERLSIVDATRPERAPRSAPYPRPGTTNASVRLGLISAEGGPTTWIDWDRERFEYLASVAWSEQGPLTLLVQDRRQTEQRLLAVRPQDGTTSVLLVERDEAWVAIDPKVPRWLPDGTGFLWTTERRGAPQLELRASDGTLRRELTPLDFGFRELIHLGSDGGIVVAASPDPTRTDVWRIPLAAADDAPVRLSAGRGVHSAVFNRSGTLWVLSGSTLDGDVYAEVHTPAGSTGHRIRSLAEHPGFVPDLELTTVGEDPTFHAAIVRPRNFDPERRYPVIDHVYGGPTSVMVRADPRRYLLDQWIADHGYIVVAIDGRGTPNRGRAWQRAVKHDLIDLPLRDQARALRLLGKEHPELDLSRVGVYGWSFGGYFAAMAVAREPELFRAGVAGAPVVDWRDYDTHYTERYMDLPQRNPEGYDAASVLTYVDRLERPLLVIHGTVDDNVYFTHSLKLVDALFRAGKPFEFLPLAGYTHMVPDPQVSRRMNERILKFFDEHLAPRP